MRRSPVPGPYALLGVLLMCSGCATQHEVGLPIVYASQVRLLTEEGPPTGSARPSGPAGSKAAGSKAAGSGAVEEQVPLHASWWQEVPEDFDRPSASRPEPIRRRLAARRQRRARAVRPAPAPSLAVPRRKARREARPEEKTSGKGLVQLARDHYIDYPTHIKAEKITFACPRSYTPRVRLTGAHIDRSRPERTRVQGGAKLVIGELTLEAERISWRVQPPGKPDIQIIARGAVHLVSDVRGNVNRETGIRSLLITNDKLVPLR